MKKILIVEDKGHIRNLLKIIFRLSGYKNLYFSKSGESCIRKIKRLKPDMMLLDINISGKMSGHMVLDTIKKESSTRASNIILLSDQIEKRERNELIGMGVSDYITIPFKPADVIRKVETYIGKEFNENMDNTDNFISFSPPVFQPLVYSERV